MPVFRVEKNSNYTTMCNYHLRDQGLSLKGKGLLSMLLSLPDTWNYSVRGLSSITPDGVDGVLTALKELERLGYLERNQQRESNGRMGRAEYVIYEMPRKKPCSESPCTEKAVCGKSDTDTPVTENPAQLSTNRTSTETINKKERRRKSSTGMAHTEMFFSPIRNTASSGRSSQEIIRYGWNGSLSIWLPPAGATKNHLVPEVLNAALDSLFTPKEPGEQEYQGEDGLLYCRNCHTPVQCRVKLWGRDKIVPCLCRMPSRKRWRKRNARMNWWSGSVKSGS